jgi:hypothetical protein
VAHIEGLWHSTAMAADYDELYGPLERLFGAVVMHDTRSEEPAVGRRGGMIWVGDNSIEIGAPLGPVSPVRGFVERWGGGMHSLALRIADLPATLERLEGLGVEKLADVVEGIIFTKPQQTAGLLLEWAATHTDDDPRWGFPLRDRRVEPLLEVHEMAWVSALVADPIAVGERLAELFGTEVLRRVPDAGPGEVGALVSLVDNVLVLVRLPEGGVSRAEWGQDVSRARFHAHSLRVPDLVAASAALADAGIAVREGGPEGSVLVDPDACVLPTYLVEALLPEDPRRR